MGALELAFDWSGLSPKGEEFFSRWMKAVKNDGGFTALLDRGFPLTAENLSLSARVTRALNEIAPGADEQQIESAIRDFRQALTELGSTGSVEVTRPWTCGELAAALAGVGRDEPARAAVEAGLDFSARMNPTFYDAELNRLKGELLLRDPATRDQAERWPRVALELSRKQRAQMLELRAAISRRVS